MRTTYERGFIEGQRQFLLWVLEGGFGPLSAEVEQRVRAMSQDELIRLTRDMLTAQSLYQLHLED